MKQILTRQTLRGVWAALIVPWTERNELDEARFIKECRSYGDTGVHGIYTGGTTGEFYAQDDRTFEAITRIACREGHTANLPVQIGCTTLSTRTARARYLWGRSYFPSVKCIPSSQDVRLKTWRPS